MSNSIVRTIVENIVSDKFDTLKEDLSKAVSSKAVTVLESKKAMVGKKFFDKMSKEPIDEISQDRKSAYKKAAVEYIGKNWQKYGDPETEKGMVKRSKGLKRATGNKDWETLASARKALG